MIRAENLKKLIDDKFDGKQIRFSQATAIHPSYVSSMLSALRGVEDAKPVSEDMADKIETALGLRPGYLSLGAETGKPASSADAAASEALLNLLETQSVRMAKMRDLIEQLRDQAISNAAMIELLCSALIERDADLVPVLTRILRQAASLAEDGSIEAFRVQAESLASHAADAPQEIAGVVPRASLRPASANH